MRTAHPNARARTRTEPAAGLCLTEPRFYKSKTHDHPSRERRMRGGPAGPGIRAEAGPQVHRRATIPVPRPRARPKPRECKIAISRILTSTVQGRRCPDVSHPLMPLTACVVTVGPHA